MNIVFFCQSCGARFEVPPAASGKKGRCKSCGQMMTVPKAEHLASMLAMPAISPAAVGAAVGAGAGAKVAAVGAGGGGGDALGWLAAAKSDVALSPLTEDLPAIGRGRAPLKMKKSYDDDLGDSKPYQLAPPVIKAARGRSSGKMASDIQIGWRKNLGTIQKLFRKANETAYLLSVPFLLMILLGAIIKHRQLALAGAAAVVLLNIGRIIAGIANLAVVPFRDSLLQGIMFLIPPMTFFYLSNHWKQVKKPTMRIVGPIITIAAVFLAFAVVPTLRKDGKIANLKDLKAEAKSFKGELIGEANKAKNLDVQGLENQAQRAIGEAAGKINSIGQPVEPGKVP